MGLSVQKDDKNEQGFRSSCSQRNEFSPQTQNFKYLFLQPKVVTRRPLIPQTMFLQPNVVTRRPLIPTLPFTGEIWRNKQNLIYKDLQSNKYEIFQCNL